MHVVYQALVSGGRETDRYVDKVSEDNLGRVTPQGYKQRVERALEEIKKGRYVIVCDDESRENEGDLIAAAELCTAELVNFAITEARGLLCQAIDEKTASYLALPMMSRSNSSIFSTAFTVSVDHCRAGTGISAAARSLTIQSIGEAAGEATTFPHAFLRNTASVPTESQLHKRGDLRKVLVKPGHIFPLVAMPGGVLQRGGQTEATVDLMTMAGFKPSGMLCEIVASNGEMSRGKELADFAVRHGLCQLTIADIATYRREVLGHRWGEEERREHRNKAIFLSPSTEIELPSHLGNFRSCMIEDMRDIGAENLLIWKGALSDLANFSRTDQAPLLRIHSQCFTGEVLSSQRCDCQAQLNYALQSIESEGRGLIVYLRQEGRGIGLHNKFQAYQLQQQQNLDTVEANEAMGFADDLREYSVAIGVLRYLGVHKVRLLSNNPHKIAALEAEGIVVERVPIHVGKTPHNRHYLQTKKNKSGHLL